MAGLCGAAGYCLILLLLARIPAVDAVLQSTLGALGRLSLSNYPGVTVILCSGLAIGRLAGTWPADPDAGGPGWTLTMWACVAILAVQLLVSHLFVKAGRQGPAEWALRRLTRLAAKDASPVR